MLLMETNPLGVDGTTYHADVQTDSVELNDPRIVQVERVRLVGDPGAAFYDVSYAVAVLKDGTRVRLTVDFTFRPKRVCGKSLVAQAIDWAKQHGRYAKGLGLDSAFSVLV